METEIIFELLKGVLPAVIAGLFTFLVTKYTYNKKSLDKLEITYNRFYYPVYKIVSTETDITKIVDQSKIYFVKYDKYIDISTKKLFDLLCDCDKKTKKKHILQSFKNNVYDKNSYLRRRLGYLEPNFFQMYKYSLPSTKSLFRITIEICIIYFSLMCFAMTENIRKAEKIYNAAIIVFLITTFVLLCEIIVCFIRFMYYKIKK